MLLFTMPRGKEKKEEDEDKKCDNREVKRSVKKEAEASKGKAKSENSKCLESALGRVGKESFEK